MSETSQKKTKPGQSTEKSKVKKRDRSASEDRLLKAAEEIYSKYGFKATTTRMIAKKADVNESLIGRYFDGKLGLFFAVIDHHIEGKGHGQLDYEVQDTLTKELLKFAESRLCEHCQKNSEFFKIVMSQALVDAKFLKKIRERIPNFRETGLEDRLEKLKADGKVAASADVASIIHDIDTYFHGTMLFDLIFHGTPRDQVAIAINHFVTNYCKAFEIK
jgi:AcrR family transcriptional regulator